MLAQVNPMRDSLGIAESEYIPLNWNENPYGPSDKTYRAMVEGLRLSNRYPDTKIVELKELIAAENNIKTEEILITSGSTEVLSLMGQHVGLKKGEILSPWPSFPTLLMFGERCGASVQKIPLNEKYQLDLNRLKDAISEKTDLVFICNPNNPTSTEVDTEELKAFCREVPEDVIILIDEAYIEYSQRGKAGSMIPLVKELPNLVVSRTFSKAHGLAGMRIGYACSQKQNIEALRKRYIGLEFCTGRASAVAAISSFNDPDFIKFCVEKNAMGRKILYDAFDEWGVSYSQSSTNFVYVKSNRFVADIVGRLKEEKQILITKWPSMKEHIRISISRPEHMRQFVQEGKEYLI